MNFKVIAIFVMMLLIGSVSAQNYTYIVKGDHEGIVITLDTNGTGTATDGIRDIDFTWSGNSGSYVAKYWFWSIPFKISGNGNVISSDSFKNDVAILKN